jgi:hypothetical protein
MAVAVQIGTEKYNRKGCKELKDKFFYAIYALFADALGFAKRVDSGLPDLSVHGGRGAADANGAYALAFECDRNTSLDADEPARAHAECLSEHLMIGDLCAFAVGFAGGSRGERRATSLGERQKRVMSTPIGHPFERKQVTARIHNGDAHDLFELLRFLDRRVDDDIRALLR